MSIRSVAKWSRYASLSWYRGNGHTMTNSVDLPQVRTRTCTTVFLTGQRACERLAQLARHKLRPTLCILVAAVTTLSMPSACRASRLLLNATREFCPDNADGNCL
jgi:hypothetical protein